MITRPAPPPSPVPAEPAGTRILLLFAHDPNSPGLLAFARELKAAVRSEVGDTAEFYEEFLDLDRFPGDARWPQLARYFSEKYNTFKPDAIVVAGSEALLFAAQRLDAVFPGVPVIYGAVYEPIVDFRALPAYVTGRRHALPFDATFKMAKGLQPEAERVVLVGGSMRLDSLVLQDAIRMITPLLHDTKLYVLQDWTYAELLDTLRQLPPQTIVILSAFRRDKRGQKFNPGDLIASITRVASAPVYGIARNWVGDGVVGGSVLDFAEDGLRVGQLTVRVLRRKPGEPMPPPETARTPLAADWRQLQRWNLPEARLPANTDVLFRVPTPWERYRVTVLAVVGVMAAQGLLIALLLAERRRRVRAQRAAEEQSAFETMIAELMTDAVRHAPEDLPRTLESSLPRIGRYAGARATTLVIATNHGSAPNVLVWTAPTHAGAERVARETAVPPPPEGCVKLSIPLVANQTEVGVLELFRESAWPAHVVKRLQAAAELIATALARAQEMRALDETREQVAHMARVVTVGELAAAVSHELRQPLAAIRAHADAGALLLAKSPPDVAEARLIFQDIAADDIRAHDVIEHIRTLLSKHKPNPTQLVDLNTVCTEAVQLVERNALASGVMIDVALDSALPRVRGDAVQLQQVVLNLTLNAIEAAASVKGDSRVTVGTLAWEHHVELFVRDTGPGLTANVERNLFHSFFSTKPQGLGLGLAIVRAIVEQHRGTVHAENDVRGGAVFSVMLPTSTKASKHGGAQFYERVIHRVHADHAETRGLELQNDPGRN